LTSSHSHHWFFFLFSFNRLNSAQSDNFKHFDPNTIFAKKKKEKKFQDGRRSSSPCGVGQNNNRALP
jgi:hypothetical protein